MAKAKITVPADKTEVVEAMEVSKTEAQAEYQLTIEQYAKTNPEKYNGYEDSLGVWIEGKKAELEEKLSRVIGIQDRSGRNIFLFSPKPKK